MRQPPRAFTVVELLAVMALMVLLMAILLPTLSQTRVIVRRSICASNQRQLLTATVNYTTDYDETYPPHRHCALNTGFDWFNLLEAYGNNEKVSRCPELYADQTDFGVTWRWAYDANYIGYGYNGYFLGLYSHPGCVQVGGAVNSHGVESVQWTKTIEVRKPSKLIVYGDSHPKTGGFGVNLGVSLTLWWPFIYVHTEGVNDRRHKDAGVVVMADGHSEVISDADNTIHPPFDGSLTNIDYWRP